MNALRVYVDTNDTDYIGSVIEELNDNEDIAATMVNDKELFVAADGECAIKYAECKVRTLFGGELSIQKVK